MMFIDVYRAGFIITAIAGAALAVFCYGEHARGDLSAMALLATTGALSGIAFWLLYMNDFLGLKR